MHSCLFVKKKKNYAHGASLVEQKFKEVKMQCLRLLLHILLHLSPLIIAHIIF